MSNRHQRRVAAKLRTASIRRFRDELGDDGLQTYLVAVTDVDRLAERPLLARAGCYWADGIAIKRPTCIACAASFAEGAKPGAFLFATASNSSAASVAAICETCWRDLSDEKIDAACSKLLAQLIPHGAFVDGWT